MRKKQNVDEVRKRIQSYEAQLDRKDYFGNIPPMPTPNRLIYKSGIIAGMEHTWVEYVPDAYDGTKPVPLLVGLHGGGTSGEKFATTTDFTTIAEKESFIIVYPDATSFRVMEEGKQHQWNAFFENDPEMDETIWLKQLIDLMCEKYAIDTSRIYLTGHSNGDCMALHFALSNADLFAACAGLNGPMQTDRIVELTGQLMKPSVPLPYLRWNGEKDPAALPPMTRDEVLDQLNNYWIAENRCVKTPKFRIDGKINTAIYASECDAEFRFVEYKGGPHMLNVELAAVVWYEFFQRFARSKDGSVILRNVPDVAPPDDEAVVIAGEASQALIHQELVAIDDRVPEMKAIDRDDDLFVPVTFLSKVSGVRLNLSSNLEQAVITFNDKSGVVRADHPVLWVEHKMFQFDTNPYIKEGTLWVPIRLIAQKLFGQHVSMCEGVMYISRKETEISKRISRKILKMLKK